MMIQIIISYVILYRLLYGTTREIIKTMELFLEVTIFMNYNGIRIPQNGKSSTHQNAPQLVYIFSQTSTMFSA